MSTRSFLENLGNPRTNIPLHTSWEVEFTLPGRLSEVSELESVSWGNVDNIPGGSVKLLAASLTHANDNYNAGKATILNNGGLLPGVINSGRSSTDSRPLVIQFIETEESFADLALRAWVIVSAHYGRIADANDLKKTITATHLGRDGSPRKTFKYYNASPTAVESVSYTYDSSKVDLIGTSWVYDNYSVS